MTTYRCTQCHKTWVEPDAIPTGHYCYQTTTGGDTPDGEPAPVVRLSLDGENETVLVLSPGEQRDDHIYHTEICQAVLQIGYERMTERDRESLSQRWRECRYCSDEYDHAESAGQNSSCPICGAAVAVPAAHIRTSHDITDKSN